MKPASLLFLGCVLFGGWLTAANAQQTTQRVRGDVLALNGATLQVQAPNGDAFTVRLTDSARITLESRTDLAAIVPGVFVGTTSAPQADGSLRAVQIRIFPEAMRGVGEGHRLMDAQGRNTMTNATVTTLSPSQQAANTMTNATVSTLSPAGAAQTMTLRFKDGEKQIVIPPDVVVIQTELGERSQLVPGAHLIMNIAKQDDGSLSTDRITIGKNGSQPQ